MKICTVSSQTPQIINPIFAIGRLLIAFGKKKISCIDFAFFFFFSVSTYEKLGISNSLPQIKRPSKLRGESNLGRFGDGGGEQLKMPLTRSETQVISHADVLDGRGIGSLSLAKHSNSCPNVKEKREPQDAESVFTDVDPLPPQGRRQDSVRGGAGDGRGAEVPQGIGPCPICGGSHSESVCAWQFVCVCGSEDVIEGICGRGSSSSIGLALGKDFELRPIFGKGKR